MVDSFAAERGCVCAANRLIRCPFVTFGPPDGLAAKRGKRMKKSNNENIPRLTRRQDEKTLIFRKVSGASCN